MEKLKISLASARVNKGFTQKQVAEHMNVSVQTVCYWEKNPQIISIKTAYDLAELYSVCIDDLNFLCPSATI